MLGKVQREGEGHTKEDSDIQEEREKEKERMERASSYTKIVFKYLNISRDS